MLPTVIGLPSLIAYKCSGIFYAAAAIKLTYFSTESTSIPGANLVVGDERSTQDERRGFWSKTPSLVMRGNPSRKSIVQ